MTLSNDLLDPMEPQTMPGNQPNTVGLNVTGVIYLLMCAAYSAAASTANKSVVGLDANLLYVEPANIVGAEDGSEQSKELDLQDDMQAQLARATESEPDEQPEP